VRTAAADSSRARSGQPPSGGPACRSKSIRRRTSACISNTVPTMSLSIRPSFAIFRRGSGEVCALAPPSLRAKRSNPWHVTAWRKMDCFVAALLAMMERRLRRRDSFSRQNRALDLAKADAIAVALAPAVHDQLVAVFEKCPLHAAGQFDRLGTVPADFQKTAALVLSGAGDGAGTQEIADIHGAAGRGVVHQLLHR